MALINIDNGALAKSSVLNDNFIFLDEKIAKTAQTLDAKIGLVSNNASTVTSNLANTQSAVNKINDDLSTLTTATESKASKDLSNVTLSSEFKNLVLSCVSPNYGAGYSISSGWTAPKAGWINARHNQSVDNQTFTLKIDGVTAFETGGGGSYSAGDTDHIELFVGKGGNVTFSGSGNIRVIFFPCKGV